MSTQNMFSWRNKKNINTFGLKMALEKNFYYQKIITITCFWYSLESLSQGSSTEYPQLFFLEELLKKKKAMVSATTCLSNI